MPVTVNENLIDDTKRELAERIFRAGVLVQTTHQARVGTSFFEGGNGQASKPGEYPRKRTGQGQANVIRSADSVDEVIDDALSIRIGARRSSVVGKKGGLALPHLVFLEKERHRLGFKKTAADMASPVRLLLEGG